MTKRGRLVTDEAEVAEIVRGAKVVAVVGMKGEDQAGEPAIEIPRRLQALGLRVVPVNPKLDRALGEKAYPALAHVAEPFDLVDVFRRIDAIPAVADEILALPPERRPRVVWLQSGIRHDASAERLAAAGIDVVQDRCLGVDAGRHRR
jgi:predicted CoA-binding protein